MSSRWSADLAGGARPDSEPIRVALLGSTGSIGRQAIEVLTAHPDHFRIVALAAGRATSSGISVTLFRLSAAALARSRTKPPFRQLTSPASAPVFGV